MHFKIISKHITLIQQIEVTQMQKWRAQLNGVIFALHVLVSKCNFISLGNCRLLYQPKSAICLKVLYTLRDFRMPL